MIYVDLSFRIRGSKIPVDHGYPLCSAVSRFLPFVHANECLGIHPISGRLLGDRFLALDDRSRLVFRLGAYDISKILPLAGKRLDVGGCPILVGVPETLALSSATKLRSRLVTIKGFMELDPFLGAVLRQMDALGIKGIPSPIKRLAPAKKVDDNNDSNDLDPYIRRTTRIHDKTIVGYALEVSGLSPEDSLTLQQRGIGGRRRFGCGIFLPVRT